MIEIIKKVLNTFAIVTFTVTFTISVMLNILAVIAGFGIYAYLEELDNGDRERIHIRKDFNIIKEPNIKVVK